MPAYLSGYNSLIGGGHASSVGGTLAVYPSKFNADYTPNPPPTLLDVGKWEILESFEEAPLPIGGYIGATPTRRMGYQYAWELDIIFDLRNPPDWLLRSIQDFQINFYLGFPTASGVPIGANDDARTGAYVTRYYWSPLNKLDKAVPVLDANTKKMVRIHCSGHATGHIFLIPDMGDPTDSSTIPGAYAAWIKSIYAY